ncbi:MAG: nucleotidyltransferase domain-containing protein [Lentisphaerae bacterium]|nr:nucleotidyltransferase domain-containing protein [Lentisphaerota bacterium]
MKNGILISKLQALEETLNELRSLGDVTSAQLSGDWRTRRAVERDLQIAVEVVIEDIQHSFPGLGVVGAWLFGSAKNGEVRDGGDVDIGVLFDAKPGLDVLASCRARLQKAMRVEDVDLVPLNGASPILRFEALCGKRVYCADENRCAEFASLTAREYEDELAMCEQYSVAN